MWFRNHYRCARCKLEWDDEWSATCDEDCPNCGARHISPYDSDDLTVIVDEQLGHFVVLCSPDTAEHSPNYRKLRSFATEPEAQAFADGVIPNEQD